LLEAYAVNQRVGMTMHLPPLRSFTTKDQGHPQRPVLVRQTAHLAVLSFDRFTEPLTSRIGSKRWHASGACTGEQHRRGETEATEVMHDLVVTVL
jgi:hypothetical protein